MLQVVKVFVAAGGLLQFAQPAQGNKSQVVKLDAVGKDVGNRQIRKAGDVVVEIEKTEIRSEHHQAFAADVGRRNGDEPFEPSGRVAFIADPAGVDRFEGLQQCGLRRRGAIKNEIGVLGSAHVTVKDDGVSANDDKWHAGASQKLKDVQGIVRT